MRTIRCSSCLLGAGGGVSAQGGVCHTPPVNRMRHLWKHYLATTTLRMANILKRSQISMKVFLPSATVVVERLCFHRCLSVHRGEVCTLWADTPLASDIHTRADTPQPGQTLPLPRDGRWSLQRTVRILLECILVWILILGNCIYAVYHSWELTYFNFSMYCLVRNLSVHKLWTQSSIHAQL